MGNKKIYLFSIVKGTKYNVEFFTDPRNFVGLTETNDKVIKLDITQDTLSLKQTIFHELLHAYFYECGLKKYCSDEILIEFLDSIIFDLMQDLQQLFNFSKRVK